MMSNHEQPSLDQLRALFSGDPKVAVLQQTWAIRNLVGMHPKFNGTQENKIFTVGRECNEHCLIETWDTYDGVIQLKRCLLLEGGQVLRFLASLAEIETLEADMAATGVADRPALPISLPAICGATASVNVKLEEHTNRLQVKVSKTRGSWAAAPGTGEWLKFGVEDIKPIGALVLQAYDKLSVPDDAAPAAVTDNETDIPF